MSNREIEELEIAIRDRLHDSYRMDGDMALLAAHDIVGDILTNHSIERKPYLETTQAVA